MIIVGLVLGTMLGWNLHYVRMRYKRPNNVRFYVARDKDGKIYLWVGKPFRIAEQWLGYDSWKLDAKFQDFICMKIAPNTLFNLKWEDEPVEVFLDLEG